MGSEEQNLIEFIWLVLLETICSFKSQDPTWIMVYHGISWYIMVYHDHDGHVRSNILWIPWFDPFSSDPWPPGATGNRFGPLCLGLVGPFKSICVSRQKDAAAQPDDAVDHATIPMAQTSLFTPLSLQDEFVG